MIHEQCLRIIWSPLFFFSYNGVGGSLNESMKNWYLVRNGIKIERQNLISSVACVRLLARTDGFRSTPALYPSLSLLLCISIFYLFLCTRFSSLIPPMS
jgi:hypothetical protein